MRERRGTTPLAAPGTRPLVDGCDGPTRSVLLGPACRLGPVLPKAPRWSPDRRRCWKF